MARIASVGPDTDLCNSAAQEFKRYSYNGCSVFIFIFIFITAIADIHQLSDIKFAISD